MAEALENVSDKSSHTTRGSVLIVESEVPLAESVSHALSDLGYSVVAVVATAQEAVRECAEKRPDVVLMDLALHSRMDGVDAAAQVRAAFDIPVVFATAHTDEELFLRAKITDPYGYLVKPFEPVEADCALQLAIQKHAIQSQLRERERYYRALVESSADLIAVVDDGGGFLYASPSHQATLDRDPEALLGASFFDLVDPRDRPRAMVLFAQAQGEEQTTHRVEIRLTHRSGKPVPFEVSAFGLCEDPAVQGVVVNARDISRRRAEQTERQRLEGQLRRLHKTKSLGIMAGGIAHDFNNLLMTILGNAELALESLPEPCDEVRNLQHITTAARRAADLTDQMLSYSGHGKFLSEILDLSQLVEEAASSLRAGLSPRIRLHCELERSLPRIEGDVAQIRTVLVNLVHNAAEAIGDEDGDIVIATGTRAALDAEAHHDFFESRRPADSYAYIEVRDTGCGIDEETRQNIFDPFFTTKFLGRGLGLASVLGIVRGHSGAIDVESEPDEGAAIRVYLPTRIATRTVAVPEAPPEEPTWRTQGRVLLVDDEPSLLELGRRRMEPLGLEVDTADNGRLAVDAFRRGEANGRRYDCVVLDLTMPEMTGREAFERIRAIRSDVPIVIATGYTQDDVQKEFGEEDLTGFLHKPYRYHELLAVLKTVFEGHDA